MSDRSPDVIFIGAGIIGSTTAYYLARAGMNLMLLDRRGLIAGGTASPACAGGVRQQGRMPDEIPLSIEAIDIWSHLEKVIHHVLTQEDSPAGRKGRLNGERLEALLREYRREDSAVFLCGPSGMMQAVGSALKSLGFSASRVYKEASRL